MRYRLFSTVAAGALALTACSPSHVDNPTLTTPPSVSVTGTAGASTPGTVNLVDPCSLLTATQVQAAFGGTSSAASCRRPRPDKSATGR